MSLFCPKCAVSVVPTKDSGTLDWYLGPREPLKKACCQCRWYGPVVIGRQLQHFYLVWILVMKRLSSRTLRRMKKACSYSNDLCEDCVPRRRGPHA